MRNKDQAQAAYTWLTVAEAALRMSVSTGTIRGFIAANELEAMDVSAAGAKRATYRINPVALDALIKARTRRAA